MFGETEERQSDFWRKLLCYAKAVSVISAQTGEKHEENLLFNGEWSTENDYICTDLGNGTVYLKLKNFSEPERIHKLYQDNESLMSSCKYLIIDVRENGGGSDSEFLPLKKYGLKKGFNVIITKDTAGFEVNYTKRNCDIQINLLEEYKQEDLPDSTKELLTKSQATQREKRGKGFIKFKGDSVVKIIKGKMDNPKKVYVISDEMCASSGDAFVDYMGSLPKVTVAGRNTMGITDYSNVTTIKYDNKYFLTYPTSRDLAVEKGKGIMGKGCSVDVYIPWTPEHLKRDVDMDTVFAMIEKENIKASTTNKFARLSIHFCSK